MEKSLSSRARFVSLVEFLVGGVIVIGHNVFHILPNEVPILFVLAWISLRLRDGGWKAAGLRRPSSWWKTVALALAAAAALQLGSELAVGPLTRHIWPQPQHVSHLIASSGLGWRQALTTLVIIWTFAAFGEELSYRGYLLTPRCGHLPPIQRSILHRHDPSRYSLWSGALLQRSGGRNR